MTLASKTMLQHTHPSLENPKNSKTSHIKTKPYSSHPTTAKKKLQRKKRRHPTSPFVSSFLFQPNPKQKKQKDKIPEESRERKASQEGEEAETHLKIT
jgi:hypothetical protein